MRFGVFVFTVFGSWQPLMKASQQCRFSVVEHPEGVVVSVPYTSCLEKQVWHELNDS